MRYDVIVIGAGLSGLMAAKTAAESGLKTMVLGKGMGLMHVWPGGMDILGYYPEDDMTVQEEVLSVLRRVIQDRPDHPYTRVGLDNIERALGSFCGLFDPEGYHYTGEPGRNTILPTGIGSVRPSYLVPSTMIAGRDIFSETTLLVGFHEFAGFYPAYAARNLWNLRQTNDPRVRSEYVEVSDITGRSTFKAASLALQFDDEGFREKVAKRIKNIKEGEKLVAFPAVLGLRDAEKVKLDLEARIGSQVFELSILPPSIPGMRLFEIFQKKLRAKGVRMILGFEGVSTVQKNGCCYGVVLKTPSGQRIHEADSYLLATGGFFGGGLRAQHDQIVEPLFNLPVIQPKGRAGWFRDELLGSKGHPINKAGIMTNSRLNPTDGNGKVILENVFVVGSILGHHDPTREKSGSGVAITTGYKAIRNLVER